jgi:hypothetical protein
MAAFEQQMSEIASSPRSRAAADRWAGAEAGSGWRPPNPVEEGEGAAIIGLSQCKNHIEWHFLTFLY